MSTLRLPRRGRSGQTMGVSSAMRNLRISRTLPALAAVLLSCPVACTAQAICPWINQATASGLVGKPMNAPVLSGSSPSIGCIFHAQKKSDLTALTISVVQMSDTTKDYAPFKAKCRMPGAPLAGVGNEAILCGADVAGTHAERVVGRVRDRAFVVTVRSSQRFKPPFSRAAIEDQAKAAAGQVAGILF